MISSMLPATPNARRARSCGSPGAFSIAPGGRSPGARTRIWQCDDNGRYHNVRDGGGERPRDDNFQGFGRTVTDDSGGYSFVTIRPVPYPGRTPHIHFAVAAAGLPRFVTQMYIAGEKLNDRDPVLLGVRDPAARARLIVPLRPAPEIDREALAARFDILFGDNPG